MFAVFVGFVGIPTSDPLVAFGWLWLATIAWRSDQPWRKHLLFLRDWLPVVALLESTALPGGRRRPLRAARHPDDPRRRVDVRLVHRRQDPDSLVQQHLYQPGHVQWWEVVVTLVYTSHFLTVPTVAVVLWLRNRSVSYRFMRRWIVLSVAGLVTYFLYPAAPPWYAAKFGYLADPIARSSTDGWSALGLHSAGNTLNALQADQSNLVAAMPSLHTAYAMMAVAFFLPVVRRRWWPCCWPTRSR